MIWVDFNNSDDAVAWTGAQLGVDFGPNACGVGVVNDDAVIAGVVFSRWSEHQCEVSIASKSPQWCNRATLAALFAFPFEYVNRLTAIVAHSNRNCRDICLKIGFTHEGRLRGFFGEDGHIYGMLRDECRWLENGRRKRAACA